MGAALAIVASTFVAEDLACIAAGALVARGDLSLTTAVAACTLGIFLGDCGLWGVGRLGGAATFGWPWLARRLPAEKVQGLGAWLERHAGAAIVAGRFMPGTRLPLYVTAGLVNIALQQFAAWAFLAALLWTPALVVGSATFGAMLASTAILSSTSAVGVASILVFCGLRASRRFARSPRGRRASAHLARLRRWEFWPMWIFYPPVAAWVAWLSIRHGGLSTVTAANPGMPDGGTVGESKSAILARLPQAWTIPWVVLPPGDARERTTHALSAIVRHGWRFPIIMKPDVGQRGTGVKLVTDDDGIASYLSRTSTAVILQPYHEGPYEAGVFYYRFPGSPRGRILSITDKEFPVLVGDGRSTIAELIHAHPRYRLQAALFLRRHAHAAGRVALAGEHVQLAVAGNHAQGTTFRDGRHLWTPELERRMDDIARAYPGFFVGRFDIRYRRVEDFMAGRDLAIVELNGATAESTNIYDPDASLLSAYRMLFRQWSIVFAIGAANRSLGAEATSLRRLAQLVTVHLSTKPAFEISD